MRGAVAHLAHITNRKSHAATLTCCSSERPDGSIDPVMDRNESRSAGDVAGRLAVKAYNARPTSPVGGADLAAMIWSHHWPEQHDRCVTYRGRRICRRCIVLYPVAFAVLLLSAFGVHWPVRFDAPVMLLLPLPVVIDFIGEQVGLIRYSARRQVVTTALCAVALGRGLGRYFQDLDDTLFWSMVLVYGGLCGLAGLGRLIRSSRFARAEANAEALCDPLAVGFATREEFVAYLDAQAGAATSGTSPVSSSTTN